MHINDLSYPLLSYVFLNFSHKGISQLSTVCKKWQEASHADYLWRKLYLLSPPKTLSSSFWQRNDLNWRQQWMLPQNWRKGIFHLKIDELTEKQIQTRVIDGEIFKIRFIHPYKIEFEDVMTKTIVLLEYEEQIVDRPLAVNKNTIFVHTSSSICLFNRKTGALKQALKVKSVYSPLSLGDVFSFKLICNDYFLACSYEKGSCVIYKIEPFEFFNFQVSSEIACMLFVSNFLIIAEKFGHIFVLDLENLKTIQMTGQPISNRGNNPFGFEQNKLARLAGSNREKVIISQLEEENPSIEVSIIEKNEFDSSSYSSQDPCLCIKRNLLIASIPFIGKSKKGSFSSFSLIKVWNIEGKAPKLLFVKKIEGFIISDLSVSEDRIVAKWKKDHSTAQGLFVLDFLSPLKPKMDIQNNSMNGPIEGNTKEKVVGNTKICLCKRIFSVVRAIFFIISQIFKFCYILAQKLVRRAVVILKTVV